MTRQTGAAQLGLQLEPPKVPQRRRAGVLRSLHLQGQPVGVDEALERDKRAQGQDREILELIRRYWPCGAFTPTEVHAKLQQKREADGKRCPLLTSTRRAITNATARGELRHWPQEKKPGPWGVDESCWSLPRLGSE